MSRTLKETVRLLFSKADITINGDRPQDIQVYNEKFYGRVLSQGSLGLGESYMDGWWDSKELDEFFNRILRIELNKEIRITPRVLINYVRARLLNRQKSDSFKIGEHHYDIGNDLYTAMLDKRMTYTCGYWKESKTLHEAQEAKLDLVCRKLGLKKGDRILDIGSGWGCFIKFAAEHYGVEAVGLTVSKEQADYANAHRNGLPIETRLQDYRDITEKFDHIVSLGMFEHVGHKNYRTYMEVISRLLKDDGLFLLHTIGGNKTVISADPWIHKYIFPDGVIPSAKQISDSIEELFVIEDWHNFGPDYDKTLMAWFKNFNMHGNTLRPKYGDRFYRMWKYYLLSCAGTFRCRRSQLWQIVLSKKGLLGGYTSVR